MLAYFFNKAKQGLKPLVEFCKKLSIRISIHISININDKKIGNSCRYCRIKKPVML